ncbi:hypothetical protein ONZ45_g19653 [Pleurotus djamor]|nr:hypothetical protein ONZ45_g19653 [Pleurotus djamor]
MVSDGKGISNLTQVTGPERKHIARILLACCDGVISQGAIEATRHLLDFIYIAQYKTHVEITLGYLSSALEGFQEHRNDFIKMKARKDFNIPKFHSMKHYVSSIRLFGSTDNYNTEMFERLHIDFAKDAWRASNKRNELPQMITWISRHEKMATFSSYIEMLKTRHLPSKLPLDLDKLSSISLAKYAHTSILGEKIETQHRAPKFLFAIKEFLNKLAPSSLKVPKVEVPTMMLPLIDFPIWYSYKLTRVSIADDETQDHLKDQIKAMPSKIHPPYGRFDNVVVVTSIHGEATGLQGTKIGRVKVIFKIPDTISMGGRVFDRPPVWPSEPLAYVEWYERSSSPHSRSLFYTVRQPQELKEVKASVVYLSQIRQSCMLTPRFGDPSWKDLSKVTTNNVLDFLGRPYYLNNFSSMYAYQSLW